MSHIIKIPSSKSISNRALLINALCDWKCELTNLSSANDTQLMKKGLQSNEHTIDVEDAGTVMRFLTAYFAVKNQHKTLTGTQRMQERPIKILVDGLKTLGASIEYLDQPGFPPLQTKGFSPINMHFELYMDFSVSSQFVSALLMIAPELPKGISLIPDGQVSSRPYIDMTLQVMNHFGIKWEWTREKITIPPEQYYKPKPLQIEPDWSSASYWYSLLNITDRFEELNLEGYTRFSIQGDARIADIFGKLGIHTLFTDKGIRLIKDHNCIELLEVDFKDIPDLALTVIVCCALKKIDMRFKGVESLRYKESDRLIAATRELEKIGCAIYKEGENYHLDTSEQSIPESISIETYQDHRMAMAFAPLKLLTNCRIINKEVVEKSYPSFWQDFNSVFGQF